MNRTRPGRDEIGHIAFFVDGRGVLEKVRQAVSSRVGVEVDEAAEKPEEVVAPVCVRAELRLVAQRPFPNEPGRVPVVFQQLRQRPSCWSKALTERSSGVASRSLELHALLVATRDEGRPRRSALGRSKKICELHTFLREAVKVGRFDVGRAIAAYVAVADVVGNDQDNVRSLEVGWLRLCCCQIAPRVFA